MAYPSAELIDLVSTLERALVASLGLDRVANELGAVAVAVLLTEGPRIEVTYFWSQSRGTQAYRALDGQQNLASAIEGRSEPVEAESPLAQLLRDWIAPDARSFLPFHWRIRRRVVTTVFGFSEPVVPHRAVPEVVAERLNLAGLATWSVREIARLRADLKIVNERLARHYGIPNITGDAFRRVSLGPNLDFRRGILGQGSFLLSTSVADRTSPVQRGKTCM